MRKEDSSQIQKLRTNHAVDVAMPISYRAAEGEVRVPGKQSVATPTFLRSLKLRKSYSGAEKTIEDLRSRLVRNHSLVRKVSY